MYSGAEPRTKTIAVNRTAGAGSEVRIEHLEDHWSRGVRRAAAMNSTSRDSQRWHRRGRRRRSPHRLPRRRARSASPAAPESASQSAPAPGGNFAAARSSGPAWSDENSSGPMWTLCRESASRATRRIALGEVPSTVRGMRRAGRGSKTPVSNPQCSPVNGPDPVSEGAASGLTRPCGARVWKSAPTSANSAASPPIPTPVPRDRRKAGRGWRPVRPPRRDGASVAPARRPLREVVAAIAASGISGSCAPPRSAGCAPAADFRLVLPLRGVALYRFVTSLRNWSSRKAVP